jgi:hypothetical protein
MVAAEEFATMLGHKRVQRFACELSINDNALIFAMVDDFPTFGVMRAGADWFVEFGSESTTAPQIFAQNWFESQQREMRHDRTKNLS